jgi:hypothetical protein
MKWDEKKNLFMVAIFPSCGYIGVLQCARVAAQNYHPEYAQKRRQNNAQMLNTTRLAPRCAECR